MNVVYHFLACATCSPGAGTPLASAANGAVWLMLGVMSLVFMGFLGMVITIVRRARAANTKLLNAEFNA
ncbi:MAG: hypothetical protein ACR2OZ_20010 [Verrucomicrobiales bacterium]